MEATTDSLSDMTDIQKLNQMLIATKNIIPTCNTHNLLLTNKIAMIRDRIHELEIEDVSLCLNWNVKKNA